MSNHHTLFRGFCLLVLSIVLPVSLTPLSRLVSAADGRPQDVIEVGGELTANTTWTANHLYLVTSTLTIPAGLVLTVEAGTMVQLQSLTSLEVYGSLYANGTAASGVTFTSDEEWPGPGSWNRIYFADGSLGQIEYATIEYAGQFTYAALQVDGGEVVVRHSVIRETAAQAIRSNVWLTLEDNELRDSFQEAFLLTAAAGSSTPVIMRGNVGSENGLNGLVIQGNIPSGSILGENPELPFVVKGSLTVPTGATVTAEAGAIFKLDVDFSNGGSLVAINGVWAANGAAGQPIVFTSYHDDDYGGDTDGSFHAVQSLYLPLIQSGGWGLGVGGWGLGVGEMKPNPNAQTLTPTTHSPPAPGDWRGLVVNSGGTADFTHVVLQYAGYGDVAAGQALGGALRLQDSQVNHNLAQGLYIEDSSPTLLNNAFEGNGQEAVVVRFLNGVAAGMAFSGNTGRNNALNGILLNASLGDNTLAANPDFPYVVEDMTIETGATVTVEAGAVFKLGRTLLEQGTLVKVFGTLNTWGTAAEPVVFTSVNQTLYGGDTYPAGARTPIAGDWRGIAVCDGGAADLEHTIIEYGGYSDPGQPGIAQLQVLTATATLDSVTVQEGLLHGIYAEDTSLVMRDSVVSANAGFGLRVHGKTRPIEPVIQNNVFNDNGTYGMYLILNGGGLGDGDISGNTGGGNGMVNGVYMEGHISDTTSYWATNPDFPWVIWTLYVDEGAKLTIAPGNVLKFINPPDGHDGVTFARGTGTALITGTLEAIGTETEPIIFTSYWDDAAGGDTNGDYGGAEVLPGDWRGFIVRPGGRAVLSHTEFRWGGGTDGGDTKAVFVDGGQAIVSYSGIYSSSWTGVGGTGAITITDSVIQGNLGNGVQFGGLGSVQWSTIVNNGGYGLANYYSPYSDYRALATNNYWGNSTGPAYDGLPCPFEPPAGLGSMINCPVEWAPYLASPP